MKIFLLLFTPLFIFAKVHYAKVEPYESVVLKSAVSALVIDVDLDAEGSMVTSKRVIHLDDSLDKVNLEDSKKSVMLLEKMLGINEEISTSLSGTVKRQEGYYNRISKLSTASKTQKDNAYSSFTSAKTQYLSISKAIMHNTKWWRPTFGFGHNWHKKTKAKLDLLMTEGRKSIQKLNDQFVSSSAAANEKDEIEKK